MNSLRVFIPSHWLVTHQSSSFRTMLDNNGESIPLWCTFIWKADSSNLSFLASYSQCISMTYPGFPASTSVLIVFPWLTLSKNSFHINIYNIVQIHLLHHFIALCECIFGTPVWSESIAPFMELCFTNRFQHLLYAPLYQSVQNSWYTQRAGAAIWLRYLFTFYRLWDIILQPFPYCENQFFPPDIFQYRRLSFHPYPVSYFPCSFLQVPVCKFDVLIRLDERQQFS